MEFHDRYCLTRIINARGSFTPLGVSRSSATVGAAVAEALQHYVMIDELQDLASRTLAHLTGADAAAVTHCVAAGITQSVAAAMAGTCPDKIALLPDATSMARRVILPATHAVNYGHPITQAIRLAGAVPVLAGTANDCSLADIEKALDHTDTGCLLLVSSRLTAGTSVDLKAATALAHRRSVPVILDGAAQDLRIPELLTTKADLVLVSAHKYMASPTAGLAIGRRDFIDAFRAQERGIGRGMKATKEAIIGVLAALEERVDLDLVTWRVRQAKKLAGFVDRANRINGIEARTVADPAGMPFGRAHLRLDIAQTPSLVAALKNGTPPIWVMEENVADKEIVFELVQVSEEEIDIILSRLSTLLT